MHLKICEQLKQGIAECADELFECWDYNWAALTPQFHIDECQLTARFKNSLHTVHFCKYFDGHAVVKDGKTDEGEELAPFYLYDLMHLKGNSGFIPRQFVQTIDD